MENEIVSPGRISLRMIEGSQARFSAARAWTVQARTTTSTARVIDKPFLMIIFTTSLLGWAAGRAHPAAPCVRFFSLSQSKPGLKLCLRRMSERYRHGVLARQVAPVGRERPGERELGRVATVVEVERTRPIEI